MPISRCEIRNEYSLADPELYRAADKDDPEALLEGVAMAGLVGVLRQLGDLAEFAVEIFHDLHEEVMATAARGNGLMIRVQQLEAEVPSIEKAFLTQTDHSLLFYNAGVGWHPNLQMDPNLVTQGDLPRFVMDFYEECRGPPRLFLLDKFDVAGAGACLKRYTDPSFFKVETSAVPSGDAQREKKIRKVKKKGPRGRHGETPEILPASPARFHQLFLEEPDENSVKKPAHRAKLKRRPNGFPFDTRTGKSYMEKLLKTPSPEHKLLNEITASSLLPMSTIDHNESDIDALELRSVSPARESVGGEINPAPPDTEDTMLNPFMNQTSHESMDIKICEVPAYLDIVTDGIMPNLDEENGQEDITVYGESRMKGSLTGYHSDDIASEIDNYMDAPSTMDSEMDTDSELRVKNVLTSSYVGSQPSVSVEHEGLHSESSDSQSTGDLTISDEGRNSCKKEGLSYLSSDCTRTSVQTPHSEKLSASADGSPSADFPEISPVNSATYQNSADEEFPVDRLPESVASNDSSPGKDALPNNKPDLQQLISVSCTSNSIPILPQYSDSGGVAREDMLMGPKSDETASSTDVEEKNTNAIIDTRCLHSVSCSKPLSGDDSPRSSSGEHLVDDEHAFCMSNITDIMWHTSNSPAEISASLLHEDDNNQDELKQLVNVSSTLNMDNVISQNRIRTEEIISNEGPTPGKLDGEVAKLPGNFAPDSTDIVHNGDDSTPHVPEGENRSDKLYNEDLNVVLDAPDCLSCIMEVSMRKELREASWTNAEIDHYSDSLILNEPSSETLILPGLEGSRDLLKAGLDTHDKDFIPEQATTINKIPEPGTFQSVEVAGLQETGLTHDATPNDRVAPKSLFVSPENEDHTGTSGTVEKVDINPNSSVTGLEPIEISGSSDLNLLAEVHVPLDVSDSKTNQSESTLMACSVPVVFENTIRENVGIPLGLDKLVVEHIPGFDDSGLVKHENDEISFSGSNMESDLLEQDQNHLSGSNEPSVLADELDEREASILSHTAFFSMEKNDRSKSDVLHTVSNSYLEVAKVQASLGQSRLDAYHESFQRSDSETQVLNDNSLSIHSPTEETMLQETIALLPDRLDQEFPHSGEKSSVSSSLLPISHQNITGHDDNKGQNNLGSLLELSRLIDHGVDVSAYTNNPPGFIPTPSNIFQNQISLDDSPPLPPLPPIQWRMGKLPHALLTTEVEKMEDKEESLQKISMPAASMANVSSSLEPVNNSHNQIVPQISLKEENAEQWCPSLEANSKHERINHPPKIENEQQQIVMHAQKADEVISPSQGTNDLPPEMENKQQQLAMPTQKGDKDTSQAHETIDLPQKIENEQIQLVMPTQKSNEVTSPAHETIDLPPKMENEQTQFVMPTQKSDEVTSPAHDTVDLPPKMENEQTQFVMPTQKSDEVTPPMEEDTVANGSRRLKLPQSCNPVIGSVAALDKSKLRKVTERDRPEILKTDERDSILEQIRAKSFSLKPAVALRPSVQGPRTNLKVAAILEKANAIRQAFAGSDEDDEGNWSDS